MTDEDNEKIDPQEFIQTIKDLTESVKEAKENQGESITIKNDKLGYAVEIESHNKSIEEIQTLAHNSFKFLSNGNKPKSPTGVN